ncbi:hypothetical protein [Desulforhabdus amnigena]|jgi:hypothetical protein|uniref:Uncharacterized protein n=1 Tax=Desulforhabdus amnigena TaxID=40218 RepID=A0A9W6D3L9_9BACT|nr:hypothetical protein [Desulforhabdus amnigena]NLJ28051.1 hypothetical protein [Deltaproteobacteria bacterium]GLI33953.1 hypothetical protein DAMNIGENAA_13860 [Desulforhabdus amnigena]
MLSEQEIRDRAHYCYCVFLQLSWLYSNDLIEPSQYLEYLKKSSLDLISDQFITMTIEEALMLRQPNDGLTSLIHLYEGFVHALCEVLETDLEEIKKGISRDFLQKLASEVDVDIRL